MRLVVVEEPPGGVVLFPWFLCFFGLLPLVLLDGLTCCATWALALRFALPTLTSSCLCLSAFVLVASSIDKSFCNDICLRFLKKISLSSKIFAINFLVGWTINYYIIILYLYNRIISRFTKNYITYVIYYVILNFVKWFSIYLYVDLKFLLKQSSLFKNILFEKFLVSE